MKRVYMGVLFAGALVMAGLQPGASGGAHPLARPAIVAVITTLVVWKAVDFWQRHRDEPTGEDPSGPGETHPPN